MKITVVEDKALHEVEIAIRCPQVDGEVQRLLALLRAQEKRLAGTLDGQTFLVDAADVLYFESVDKRTFMYTQNAVLETPLRLYELEDRLSSNSFFRAGKSVIVNIAHISSLQPTFGNRLELAMESGEKLMVSRQYAPHLKEKLGL